MLPDVCSALVFGVSLRQKTKFALRSLAASWSQGIWSRLPLTRGTVRILTYHRVLPAQATRDQFVQPGMYVSDVSFENHVAYLNREFRILSVGELLDLWDIGRWDIRERYC